MLARRLSLLALVLAGMAQAAPAPFQKAAGPEQAEVNLSGALPDARLAAGAPAAIVSRADYLSVARAWGIAKPPEVDFRTHFLAVYASGAYGSVSFDVDGRGDLRAVVQRVSLKCCLREPGGSSFRIKSFPRSAVKTVNGAPLPRK
jgi:hypothetical protein